MNIKVKKILKSILNILAKSAIIVIVFLSGLYLASYNKTFNQISQKETLYLGALTGKYKKVDGQWVKNIDFDYYWEVWDILKNTYVDKDKIKDKELFYGSLKGLVSSLNDPYSEFMNPLENEEFNNDMSGVFEGIGAELGIRNNILTVISPLNGTPAQIAGIMAGDKILEIDGESTQDISINEAVSKIKGEKGTEVVLSIFRDGFEDIKRIAIIRDTIVIKSVRYEELDDNLFLISIDSFNNTTKKTLLEAIAKIKEVKPRGLIIDLRNNPGGYLDTAVDILGEWINGKTAVIEKFGDGRIIEYKANGSNSLENYETVVLINNGSASASEIVAGALLDYEKAVIIGEQSYGKGSVQILEDLSDGSALRLTVAEWISPYGQSINKTGIKPDIEVDLSYEDYLNNRDPQLDKAKEYFK